MWFNPATHRRAIVPDHPGDVHEGTACKIVEQAGLTVDEFLEL